MKKKILKILEMTLNVNLKKLNWDDISPQNIEEWDSLSHLNLIMVIEEEFNVKFEPYEIFEMLDGVESIYTNLNKREQLDEI